MRQRDIEFLPVMNMKWVLKYSKTLRKNDGNGNDGHCCIFMVAVHVCSFSKGLQIFYAHLLNKGHQSEIINSSFK